MTEEKEQVVGGPASPRGARRWKRAVADLIDLFAIPFLIGLGLAFLIVNLSDLVKAVILGVLNVSWILFRDAVFSPGRWLTRLRLVNATTGERASLGACFIRNILIITPMVLLGGYTGEFCRCFVCTVHPEKEKKFQLIRKMVFGVLIFLSIVVAIIALAVRNLQMGFTFLVLGGVLAAFTMSEKAAQEGNRLGDAWAKTRVVGRE